MERKHVEIIHQLLHLVIFTNKLAEIETTVIHLILKSPSKRDSKAFQENKFCWLNKMCKGIVNRGCETSRDRRHVDSVPLSVKQEQS